MTLQPPSAPARSASTSSHVSTSSTHDSRTSSSSSPTNESRPQALSDSQTPQPQPGSQQFPSQFLPSMTSSPPPHPPAYVPPPQHAMAPDPIHGINMPGQSNLSAWSNGPGGPWRTGPVSFPSQGRPMPNGHDTYASRSAAGASSNHNILQQAIYHGTTRPESRGARSRERSIGGETERDSREEEVISTIFVVGFPDDMLEREFQNIFTFSPGFEAATLKFPSGSQRGREPTALLLAELQQIQASQQAAAAAAHAAGEPIDLQLQSPLEEAIAALSLGGTASTSASTTPSAAVSLTPSAPSGPTFGGPSLPQLPSRRQTIGFARFKTRADALAAKEHLQGRKIDPLTGATLKAEMAKKNLHTKRNNPSDELVGMLLRSSRLSGLVNPPGQPGSGPHLPGQSISQAPVRDAWEWQGPDKADDKFNYYGGNSYGGVPPAPPSTLSQPAPVTNPTSSQSNASVSPALSVKSPNERPTDSKALLALAEEADELEGWSVGGAVGIGMDGFTTSRTPAPTGPPTHPRDRSQVATTPGSASVPNASAHLQTVGHLGMYRQGQEGAYGTSPPGQPEHGGADTSRGIGLGVTGANPADQNPPINTLYVGNLPAISPPTHPPNFLEESLRALFVRCAGYKRMSFRQKINGPMCFVEFDDIPYAAQAIKDLYGHNLGGLVKGGIRLSYSKNSLGQRGNGHPGGSAPQYGGLAHNVALAGMSPTAQTSTPGYGLQLNQPVPGAPAGPQSAPIPMPGNLRRGSETATGLSPNAQPFNASLPVATSPRSRYFGSSPSKLDTYAYAAAPNPAQPIPAAQSQGNAGGSAAVNSAQFSPVSSPIRTPASFSWVSSGQSTSTTTVMGNGGYTFDPFSGGGMSLSGAASAWQSGTNGTPMS